MSYALTQKGQVTIPKAIRERLGVAPGDSVEFAVNDRGEVTVKPAAPAFDREAYRKRIQRLVGCAGPGPSTEEIMRATRGDDWGRP